MSKALHRFALLVSLAALLTVLASGTAQGAVSFANTGEFGTRDFSAQSALAVDEATGNVFVADLGSPGVKVYDPDAGAGPLLTFGAADLPAPDDVAVDQSDGSVYVGEHSTRTEVQEVGAVFAVGGTYRLELAGEKTVPIPYDAGEEVVLAALEGLSSIGPGDVDIVFFAPGGVIDLAFKGALAFTNVDQVEVDASGLQDDGANPVFTIVTTLADGARGGVDRFVPDVRSDPTSYSKDLSYDAPARGDQPDQVSSFGLMTLDPVSGDLLILDTERSRIDRFAPNGEFIGAFEVSPPPAGDFSVISDLLVAPSREIYLLRTPGAETGAKVEKLSASGAGGGEIAAGQLDDATSLAFDPRLDHLIVGWAFPNYEHPGVSIVEGGQVIDRVELPGLRIPLAYNQVALDGASGRLYAGTLIETPGLGWQSTIQTLEPIFIPEVSAPTVLGGSGGTSAAFRFNGTLDPLGRATTYHFEYSTDEGATWAQSPELSAGSGQGQVPANAEVSLSLDTKVQLRLVIASGALTKTSKTLPYTTPALPEVRAAGVDRLEPSAATLSGVIRRTALPTSIHFEFGTSPAYGSRTPELAIGAGEDLHTAAQEISGLSPQTTYHYRLVAENAVGVTVGVDGTFTTPPALESGGAPSGAPSASPSPSPSPPVSAAPKRCAKGTKARRQKGKVRCVRQKPKKSKQRSQGRR